jgi:hypothetical protein
MILSAVSERELAEVGGNMLDTVCTGAEEPHRPQDDLGGELPSLESPSSTHCFPHTL